MSGDLSLRVPGDMELPTKFLSLFTPGHLIRIAIPTAAAFGMAYPFDGFTDAALFIAGGIVGAVFAFVQPKDRTLDQHVRTIIRYQTERRTLSESIVAAPQQRHYRLENGAVIGVVKVAPTNLSLQSEAEQQVLHGIYQDLLDTISYPVEVHSRQRQLSLDDYLTQVATVEDNIAEHREKLREAYTAYCQHFNDSELVATDHYITIQVEPDTAQKVTAAVKNAAQTVFKELPVEPPFDLQPESADDQTVVELERRLTDVTQAISSGKLSARRMSGPPLVELAEQVRTPEPGCTGTWTTTPNKPEEAEEDEDGGVDGEYRQTVAITEYPSTVSLAWPVDLLQVDGMVDIVQRIEPDNPGDVSDALAKRVNRLQAEITSQRQEGNDAVNNYEARVADANWMLDRLADREDSPIQYGCYISAHHRDEQQCRATMEYVETQLQTKQFDYTDAYMRTDEAFRSQSMLHGDALHEHVLMPSSGAASGFPFATTDAIQESGVVYGTDATEATPILLDRFDWDAGHTARMGRIGSGKSYGSKLEIMRSLIAIPDLQVFIIDPKDEYQSLAEALNGSVYTLGEDEYRFDAEITCFRVPDIADQQKIELLQPVISDVYHAAAEDDRPTLVFIDEAHNVMESKPGRRTLETFVRESRSTNTGITLISQNAADFTSRQEGRVILDNTTGKVFHKHDRVDPSVKQYFDLSDREAQELKHLATGRDTPYSEAILKVGSRVDAKIKIHSTVPEHRVIAAGESVTEEANETDQWEFEEAEADD